MACSADLNPQHQPQHNLDMLDALHQVLLLPLGPRLQLVPWKGWDLRQLAAATGARLSPQRMRCRLRARHAPPWRGDMMVVVMVVSMMMML